MDQDTTSVRTQGSNTAAHYRFITLNRARIFIRPGPPPTEIQPRIDNIIQREISDERKHQLSGVVETLCNDLIGVLGGPGRQDDCIEPIRIALSSIDSGRKFKFLTKAGIV